MTRAVGPCYGREANVTDELYRQRSAGTPITAPTGSANRRVWIQARVQGVIQARNRRHGAKKKANSYDKLTKDVIRRVCTRGSTCVDVGAAVGKILRQIVNAAPDGQHYAVEPIPTWAAKLRRKFPAVHVIEAAASDVQGDARYSLVITNPFYSGLRPRPYPSANDVVKPITVQTVRLDDAIPADQPVSFLKIDVEGGEVQVFRGAQDLLRRDHPIIVFEHGGVNITREYGTTSKDLWSILSDDLGYSVYCMADWLTGQPPLTQKQFLLAQRDGEFQFVAAA
jgi:FkbM family methyltransferase